MVLALVLDGCASSAGLRPPTVGERPAVSVDRGQWLFRAELDSRESRTSLRLTLRQFGSEEFELSAFDLLGQPRWRLLVGESQALIFDPIARRYCRIDRRAPLVVHDFRSPLPLEDLSRLLRFRLPEEAGGDAVAMVRGEAAWVDGAKRRWTGERSARRWTRWTLWAAERPVLWFRVEGEEATLSGQEPAFQLRWREAAREELPTALKLELSSVAGFEEGGCFDSPAS